MSKFTEALLVSPLADGKSWVVIGDFGYHVGHKGSDDKIEVEKGFVTDFASVPRLFWWFIPKWGKYGNATVIHDWLYWTQDRTRAEADRIMLEGMEVLEVSYLKRYFIYGFVRLFGWWAWLRNQWDRTSGLSRVIDDTHIKSSVTLGRPGILRSTLQQLLPFGRGRK